MQTIEQPINWMVVGDGILDDGKVCRRNAMRDEAAPVRVGATHAAAGERKIDSDPRRKPRQEIGAANVWQETNTNLRHGHAEIFAGDTVRTVKRDADATAEKETIDQRHVRPDEFFEPPDMGIGGAVEFTNRVDRALLEPLMQHFEIAATREH